MRDIEIEITNNYDLLVAKLGEYWENIAINIFEWKGLEDISPKLTSEIIERWLYENGKAVFFKDMTKGLGTLCLPASTANGLNVYKQPIAVQAIGNGYSATVDLATQGVLIKDTPSGESIKSLIEVYISKLADIELTKDVHRNAHKTPLIIETSKDTELSAKNIWHNIRANKPVIYQRKMQRAENEVSINVLNTDVPYINDVLEDDYHNYEARILTILGLDNYVEDKKERVQSAEVESNQEYIISSFRVRLEQRQKACEAINEMFGLHLSVEYVKGEEIEENEEVEEDGELHSGTMEDN